MRAPEIRIHPADWPTLRERFQSAPASDGHVIVGLPVYIHRSVPRGVVRLVSGDGDVEDFAL